MPKTANQILGRLGERLALEHYERLGFRLLDRNCRTRAGEIDLVVCDSRTTVFAEVKTRRAGGLDPLLSITATKRRRMRALAAAWLADHPARPHTAGCADRRRRGRRRRPRRARLARAVRGRRVSGYSASCWYALDWNDNRCSGETPSRAIAAAMLGRRVADVRREVPARVALVGAVHETVARDLGDDRGSRDRRARGVAVDDRALLEAELGDREAVDQAQSAGTRHAPQSVAQSLEVHHVQPAVVDAAHRARHDDDAGARTPGRADRAPRAPRGRAAWSRSARSASAARGSSARRSRTAPPRRRAARRGSLARPRRRRPRAARPTPGRRRTGGGRSRAAGPSAGPWR